MQEIEVKILEVDVPSLTARLEGLGAKKVFEGDSVASLYDFPDHRLSNEKTVLRLRTMGDQVQLTYKRRLRSEGVKEHDEHQVLVSDEAEARSILHGMGLVEIVAGRRKHRTSYVVPGTHFEIDAIEGMPPYLEIEVEDETLIPGWLERLGYAPEQAKAWGVKDVYEHYGVPYPVTGA